MNLQSITPFLIELVLQTHLIFFLLRLRFFHQKSQLVFSYICSWCFGIGHLLFQIMLTYWDYFIIKGRIIVMEHLRFLIAGLSLAIAEEQ